MKEFRQLITPDELEGFGSGVFDRADSHSEEGHRAVFEQTVSNIDSTIKSVLIAQSGLSIACEDLSLSEVMAKVSAVQNDLAKSDEDYSVKYLNLEHYLKCAKHALGLVGKLKDAHGAEGLEKDKLYLAAVGAALAFSGAATYYPVNNAYTYSGYHAPDLMTQELPWNNALRVKGSNSCAMRDIILAAQLLWANSKNSVPKWKEEEGKKIKLVSLPVDHPSFLTHLRRKTRIDERITDTEIYAATAILEAWRGLFELQEDEKRERDPNDSNIRHYKKMARVSLDNAELLAAEEERSKINKRRKRDSALKADLWSKKVKALVVELAENWKAESGEYPKHKSTTTFCERYKQTVFDKQMTECDERSCPDSNKWTHLYDAVSYIHEVLKGLRNKSTKES